MNRLLHIGLIASLYLCPLQVLAIGDNADHIHETDGLSPDPVGPDTRYAPEIRSEPGVVVDEVYFRIEFDFGEDVSINRLLEVRCDGTGFGPLTRDDFKHQVVGQDLIISYGFTDQGDEAHLPTDCWDFLVSGTDPVTSVEVLVSYHVPGAGAMPDLYSAGDTVGDSFPGDNNLFVNTVGEIGMEGPGTPITGSVLLPEAERSSYWCMVGTRTGTKTTMRTLHSSPFTRIC